MDVAIDEPGIDLPRALRIPIGMPPGSLPLLAAVGKPQDPETALVETRGHLGITLHVPGKTVGEVNARLAAYPHLAGGRPAVQTVDGGVEWSDDPAAEVQRNLEGRPLFSVNVSYSIPETMTVADLWRRTRAICAVVEPEGDAAPFQLVGWALPYVGGALSPSPLMLWWALLLGLSTLARYEPAAWTAALDLDSSPIAVGLERVLDTAEQRVPARILEALRHAEMP